MEDSINLQDNSPSLFECWKICVTRMFQLITYGKRVSPVGNTNSKTHLQITLMKPDDFSRDVVDKALGGVRDIKKKSVHIIWISYALYQLTSCAEY